MDILRFALSPIDGHLCCSHLLAVVHSEQLDFILFNFVFRVERYGHVGDIKAVSSRPGQLWSSRQCLLNAAKLLGRTCKESLVYHWGGVMSGERWSGQGTGFAHRVNLLGN